MQFLKHNARKVRAGGPAAIGWSRPTGGASSYSLTVYTHNAADDISGGYTCRMHADEAARVASMAMQHDPETVLAHMTPEARDAMAAALSVDAGAALVAPEEGEDSETWAQCCGRLNSEVIREAGRADREAERADKAEARALPNADAIATESRSEGYREATAKAAQTCASLAAKLNAKCVDDDVDTISRVALNLAAAKCHELAYEIGGPRFHYSIGAGEEHAKRSDRAGNYTRGQLRDYHDAIKGALATLELPHYGDTETRLDHASNAAEILRRAIK